MKTDEQKLSANGIAAVLAVLDGLCVIHEHGGYGTIELKVKDGMVMVVKPMVEWHINNKKNA